MLSRKNQSAGLQGLESIQQTFYSSALFSGSFCCMSVCAVKIDNLVNGHLQLEHPQHAQQLRGHSQPADTPSLVLVHCIRLLHYCRSRVTSIADESPSSAIKFTARTSRRERRPLLRARQHPQQAQRHLSQHMQSKQVKTRG